MSDRLHEPLAARVKAQLDEIKDPCSLASGTPLGLTEMGIVEDVAIDEGGAAIVSLRLTSPFCHMIGFFHQEIARIVGSFPGISGVRVVADNGLDWAPSMISPAAQARRDARLQALAHSAT